MEQEKDYLSILKQYWGYDSFRGIQEDIIRSIGAGRDTLGLMPTGGGKSITFQVPALAQEGLCLVITPLIALMKDQVQNLRNKGIKATAVYSGMTGQDIVTALENCIYGGYKFLYISPERLGTESFRLRLRHMQVSMITVDESHCISQWGYDFRPAYLKIADIRDMLPGVPVLALTATATPEVVKDIQEKLHFREENVFRMSFERKNLTYVVRRTEDKAGELLHILSSVGGSAIVYVRNRRRTKELAEWLTHNGVTATHYHAGLDNVTKDLRQQDWQSGKTRVIVATNAFGMGIDKPDVRLVAHIDLPSSIEAYFQEAGRAGRDGNRAYAVILYSKSDRAVMSRRISDTFPPKDYIRDVYEKLQYYYQMAMGDGYGCIKMFNINDFCLKFKFFPVPVDSALQILTQAGYLEYTEDLRSASMLMILLRKDELYRLHETDQDTDRLIQVILRTYSGLFADYVYIHEDYLSLRTGLDKSDIYHRLLQLSRQHIVSYIPRTSTPYIIYTRERVEKDDIVIPPSVYEERRERLKSHIEAMVNYVENEVTCRSRLLLNYFGEDNPHDCGRCDNCLRHKHTDKPQAATSNLRTGLLGLLKEGPQSLATIADKLGASRDDVAAVAEKLADEEAVTLKNGMLALQ